MSARAFQGGRVRVSRHYKYRRQKPRAMTPTGKDSGPIGLGIVGLGMAGAVMVHAAADHPDFVLKAAADSHAGPRAAFASDHNAPAHEDIQMLVRDKTVSVVYIATPHQFHAEHAVLAAEHG